MKSFTVELRVPNSEFRIQYSLILSPEFGIRSSVFDYKNPKFVGMKSAILLTVFLSLVMSLKAQQEYYLITGTYTSGKSKGIYVHRFNTLTGKAQEVSHIEVSNPSYLCTSPDGKFVYSIQENGKGEGGGEVSAFSFNAKNGQLKKINTQPTGGDHPCYVAIDHTGKWVAVANYSGGNLSIFPVNADGSLGAASDMKQHTGSGINKERQEKPHVHSTVVSPDNKKIFASDLGIDKIMSYDLDPATGKLSASSEPFVSTTPGGGPRHLTFDPKGKFAYLIEELSGHVVVYKWKNGKLKQVQRVSSLAPGQKEFAGSADIHVSPDGRYLYASNRADYNNIAIFRIDPKKGTLSLRGHQPTLGQGPRHFNFDPSGKFLLVGNQNSDAVVVFSYNSGTGALTDTGNRIDIGKPVCFAWAKKGD